MAEKNGGPAFPHEYTQEHMGARWTYTESGMTLRDYFAAKAMHSLLTTVTEYPDKHWRMGVALDAYMMADAMLAAREADHA